jgi:hypothetical protein
VTRKRQNLTKLVVTAVLCSMLHLSSPPPASAQFGGIVHDPVTLAAHIRQWAEDLRHWLETVQYYAKTVEKAAETVTNTAGILRTVERSLGFNKEMLQTISNIGHTIRTAYRIKTLMEGMVTARMRAIARIHDNIARGIFDGDAIKRELRNYLLYELGEVSEQTLTAIEQQELNDLSLQMMDLELQILHKRIADCEKSEQEAAARIEQMRDNPDEVTQLDIQLASLDADNRQYEADLARDRERAITLERETLERRTKIAKEIIESRRFGKEIDTHSEAGQKMTDALNGMRKRAQKASEDEDDGGDGGGDN